MYIYIYIYIHTFSNNSYISRCLTHSCTHVTKFAYAVPIDWWNLQQVVRLKNLIPTFEILTNQPSQHAL